MKQRTLGIGGPAVSAIGFACDGLHVAGARTTLSHQEQLYMLQAASDFGVTFFDASPAHEELLGQAIAHMRQRVVVSSTFGPCPRPEHIRQMAEATLQRLKLDAIDLLSPHRLDPNVPVEDVAGAVQDLIAQGKVQHFGLGGVDAATLQRAHAVQPVSVLQCAYSMWNRTTLPHGTLQTCEELGIGLIARSPLAHGAMVNAAPCDAETMARLCAIARRQNATVAQLALAWLLAQTPWTVPMPATRRVGHLDENLGAADLTLSAEDLEAIDAALFAATPQKIEAAPPH